MLTIINNNTDPRFNLAVEEYVLKYLNLDEDFVLIWQNSKCVIIGRNQNPFKELDGYFLMKNNIPVIRRTTDGSSIYHDLGNINFAFVTKNHKNKTDNCKFFLNPIVDILHDVGIKATIRNKNNLYIGKDKISINYQNTYKDKLIHHGILFFDSNLQNFNLIQHIEKVKLVNIKKYFQQQMTVSMFKVLFLHQLFEGKVGNKVYNLDESDLNKINQLVNKKYNNWNWNYGESSEFLIKREYENRMLFTLIIKNGIINEITIDSFENTIKLEKKLLNVRYDEDELRKVLKPFREISIDRMIKTLLY